MHKENRCSTKYFEASPLLLCTPKAGAKNGTSIQELDTQPGIIPFSQGDKEHVRTHLMKSSQKSVLQYDITIETNTQPCTALVLLRSKNYGYDFALVQRFAGKGLFGALKSEIGIYRSVLGQNAYHYLQPANNLSKSLAFIDQDYANAASAHLA